MLLDLGVKRAAILAGPLSDEDFGIGATLVVEAGVVYRDTLASPHTPSAFLAVAITTNSVLGLIWKSVVTGEKKNQWAMSGIGGSLAISSLIASGLASYIGARYTPKR